MSPRRECAVGHVYFKTSDCPTCPKCEASRKPARGFLADVSAPARRALTAAGLTSLARLSRCTEDEVSALHGMGPSALRKLQAALDAAGRGFARRKS